MKRLYYNAANQLEYFMVREKLYSLKEVGVVLGITRQRVSQLIKRGASDKRRRTIRAESFGTAGFVVRQSELERFRKLPVIQGNRNGKDN